MKLAGRLSIYFYDTEAGSNAIRRMTVPARSGPQVLEVVVDASNVPSGRFSAVPLNCLPSKPRVKACIAAEQTFKAPSVVAVG